MKKDKIKKYFNKFLTYNEVKEVERIIRMAAYEALVDAQWEKMQELTEKLKYWRKLILIKYDNKRI